MARPDTWNDRLLSFAFSALVAVLILRFVWSQVTGPLLPIVAFGVVIVGYFRLQHHR